MNYQEVIEQLVQENNYGWEELFELISEIEKYVKKDREQYYGKELK